MKLRQTKKIAYLTTFLSLAWNGILFGQSSWQISSGFSTTDYVFKLNNGSQSDYFQPGSGVSFQVGYVASLFDSSSVGKGAEKRMEFKKTNPTLSKILNHAILEVNLIGNQLNASGYLPNVTSIDYQTQYLGLKTAIGYKIFSVDNWELIGKFVVSGQKLIWGKQYLSNSQQYYDLTQKANYPEFNNSLLHIGWEVALKKQVNKQMGLFFGLTNTSTNNSSVTKNGSDYTLNFKNRILQFGVSFNP